MLKTIEKYLWLIKVIGLSTAIVGVMYLPAYFRNEGYKVGYKVGKQDLQKVMDIKVAELKAAREIEIAITKEENDRKFIEAKNEYTESLKNLDKRYADQLNRRLLFNKDRICSSTLQGGTTTQGEGSSKSDGETEGVGLLPESNSRSFTQIAYEADKMIETINGLQKVINNSKCFIKE